MAYAILFFLYLVCTLEEPLHYVKTFIHRGHDITDFELQKIGWDKYS